MAFENRNATVEATFGDGTYVFRLPLGQLEELQERAGVGPYKLAQRLLAGEWHTQDVIQTIRLGLIGGGLPAREALALTQRYAAEEAGWLENVEIAQRIIWAALAGAPEEEPGKDSAPESGSEA